MTRPRRCRRPERRSCRAAGGDPPAAAQPDQGAAGGALAASARARLLRILRQRLQVRPAAQSGCSREPPLPPAGPQWRRRLVSPALSVCVSAACTRTCSPEPTSTSRTRKTSFSSGIASTATFLSITKASERYWRDAAASLLSVLCAG